MADGSARASKGAHSLASGASHLRLSSPHPRGVRPLGSLLLLEPAAQLAARRCRAEGLGALAALDDEALLHLALGARFLGAADLARLGACSRAAAAFCAHDDLWRSALLREFGGCERWRFEGDWRATYVAAVAAAAAARRAAGGGVPAQAPAPAPAPAPVPAPSRPPVSSAGLHSDLLFSSWASAAAPIPARWSRGAGADTLPRRAAHELTPEAFSRDFEVPGVPVVLTGCAEEWRACGAGGAAPWTLASLAARADVGATRFHAAGFDASLASFADYVARGAGGADQPLYLFDKDFAAKAPALAQDYETPRVFGRDLFALLGERRADEGAGAGAGAEVAGADAGAGAAGAAAGAEVEAEAEAEAEAGPVRRPDYRWLIAGPRKSGSVFHKDPNGTSAWNACISGSKKWVLFPPHEAPPGVFPSADGASVEAPVSVMEWFANFYAAAHARVVQGGSGSGGGGGGAAVAAPACKRARLGRAAAATLEAAAVAAAGAGPARDPRCVPMEGVVRAGEVIFVPAGWWHCVLNLEDGVAVTHNFCAASPAGLRRVLRQLRDAPHTISGVPLAHAPRLLGAFRAALARSEPELLRAAEKGDEGEEQEVLGAAAAAEAGVRAGAGSAGTRAKEERQPSAVSAWARARGAAGGEAGAAAAAFSMAAAWGAGDE